VKDSLNTFIFPRFVIARVDRSTTIRIRESEFSAYEIKNWFSFNQAIPL
jgi:hypothetical protein